MFDNIILQTDSYKLNHWNQYPEGTEVVYSYLEAREGAKYPKTVFFGLQSILKDYLEDLTVTTGDIDEARELAEMHFGGSGYINQEGWEHIIEKHDGKLPLRIRAVPEGTPVPVGNVLMTVENTDPACFWLTNALESLLTHVWYPSTVASLSYHTKQMLKDFLEEQGEPLDGLPFMLHDFGFRGAATSDAAAIGGAAHLVNFVGTDTLVGMTEAIDNYNASLGTLAFSVPATEHSVMTALGEDGEAGIVEQLIQDYPKGILSVVADSYDIYRFVDRLTAEFKEMILERDGVFVVRPDSVTDQDPTPALLTTRLMWKLWNAFSGEVNAKGYKLLDPHVRMLWGDGIGPESIALILRELALNGFSAQNMVFGMGGGLLQKVNRDTQRFAFKASAMKINGEWHDVHKDTYGKQSKGGRLRLNSTEKGEFLTEPFHYPGESDILETVFENGELLNESTFDEVRSRAV